HRAHRGVQQGVDQRGLPLLELADHEHVEGRIGQALAGRGQPGQEVRARVRLGCLPAQIDHGQSLLNGRRTSAGVGVPRHLRNSSCASTLIQICAVSGRGPPMPPCSQRSPPSTVRSLSCTSTLLSSTLSSTLKLPSVSKLSSIELSVSVTSVLNEPSLL